MDLTKMRKWLAIIQFMKPDDDTVYITTKEVEGIELSDAVDLVYSEASYNIYKKIWNKFLVRSIQSLED